MNMDSQTIIVVGAGSGIGRAVALGASKAGARVILAGRNRATLEATAEQLAGPGAVDPVDASNEAEVAAFFERVGRFDHLVSTASQSAGGLVPALDAGAVQKAMAAKLWAPFFLVKHGAPRIAPQGSFTFFSGFRAARPAAGSSITSLVNGGLEAFTRAMALELAPIRVNAISPGVVDSGAFWDRLGPEKRDRVFADFTRQSLAGRVGRLEEQVAAVLFVLANRFLTGVVLPVDGGGQLM
jgi:NAD(P)-dependent dehydrogenase (short-subunit alcohol dehydrogenase family)